jgi:uncharacterized protein
MKMKIRKAAAALALIAAAPGRSEVPPSAGGSGEMARASTAVAEPTREVVSADGLVGDLYVPNDGRAKHPAVLVLGGSEGGVRGSTYEARDLARHGFVAFAVAYFGAPGVPEQLVGVPVEYFGRALKLLAEDRRVEAGGIGLVGSSKGGDAALLVAADYAQVRAVVAGVPSSVAWQGIDAKDRMNPGASWSRGGHAVPFLPYDTSAPFTSVHDLYARSLGHLDAHPDAVIRVERINGPVMLVCGKDDTMWPSCDMSDAVAERLKSRHFGHPVVELSYDRAGHAAFGVPIPDGNPAKAMLLALGGDIAGNEAARADSWTRAIAFLHRALDA